LNKPSADECKAVAIFAHNKIVLQNSSPEHFSFYGPTPEQPLAQYQPTEGLSAQFNVSFYTGEFRFGLCAGDTDSNWVSAGNAMNTLAGKGVSVVAPAGGAYSVYTDWEQDGSKQWDTFLSSELPNWLSANKGLAPGGHAVVGAAQGGTAAVRLAAFHPDRFRYAGSMCPRHHVIGAENAVQPVHREPDHCNDEHREDRRPSPPGEATDRRGLHPNAFPRAVTTSCCRLAASPPQIAQVATALVSRP
jgi:hypothetical protein